MGELKAQSSKTGQGTAPGPQCPGAPGKFTANGGSPLYSPGQRSTIRVHMMMQANLGMTPWMDRMRGRCLNLDFWDAWMDRMQDRKKGARWMKK